MPSRSKSETAAQYHNHSIYVMLSSRGALPDFHWGLFIPTNTPSGDVWHATNRTGGWNVTPRTSDNVPFSMSLVLAYKIGSISPSSLPACRNVLNAVPCHQSHSSNTGEPFSCRVWVKDALFALHEHRIILLPRDLSMIERELVARAYSHKAPVEEGEDDAKVENFGL